MSSNDYFSNETQEAFQQIGFDFTAVEDGGSPVVLVNSIEGGYLVAWGLEGQWYDLENVWGEMKNDYGFSNIFLICIHKGSLLFFAGGRGVAQNGANSASLQIINDMKLTLSKTNSDGRGGLVWIKYRSMSNSLKRCDFVLHWTQPDALYPNRAQHFFADPRNHGFPLPEDICSRSDVPNMARLACVQEKEAEKDLK